MSSERPEAPSLESLDAEGKQSIIKQAFDLWITPEIERRREAGALPEAFELSAAQRLQWPDGRLDVRLNEEIQGIASVRASRPIEAGEQVSVADLDGLVGFDLGDEELDAGHWTLIRTRTGWFVGFNFLSNRAKCGDLLSKAAQFLQSAREANGRAHAPVVVDNLFSACELIAKAELVTSRQVDLGDKSHGRVHTQINNWRKAGNVEGAFVDLLNRLGQLRPRYRYDATVSEPMPVTEEDLDLVENMIGKVRQKVGPGARIVQSRPA